MYIAPFLGFTKYPMIPAGYLSKSGAFLRWAVIFHPFTGQFSGIF